MSANRSCKSTQSLSTYANTAAPSCKVTSGWIGCDTPRDMEYLAAVSSDAFRCDVPERHGKHCTHIIEDLVPVFDDGGNIECADGVLSCNLLDAADYVLRGYATFGDKLVFSEGTSAGGYGWCRELLWAPRSFIQTALAYDEEIPF